MNLRVEFYLLVAREIDSVLIEDTLVSEALRFIKKAVLEMEWMHNVAVTFTPLVVDMLEVTLDYVDPESVVFADVIIDSNGEEVAQEQDPNESLYDRFYTAFLNSYKVVKIYRT